VTAAARESHNEREFQTRADRLLQGFAERVEVNLLFREEYTLATGRADAVYNRLVIEYENPRAGVGTLRPDIRHRPTAHAVQQAKDYIEGVAKRERHDKERLLGVAFDGHYLIFVRFREGAWHVEPALEWNQRAAARLLRSVVSLSSGRALIPENLVEDFGARNIYSQRVTRALYHALDGHEDDLVGALFQQWRLFFSEVSGYQEATARLRDKPELRQFARGMGLRAETADPPRLFFAIHTYFSFLAKAIARLVLERYAAGGLGTTPLTVLANLDGDPLRLELERLEEGGIFRTLGFVNLLEGDFFGWYLHAWSDEVKDALQLTLRCLAEYNPATIEEDPYAARDLLKKLYHYLMPRELRHDLGEYYTPDWLATRVLRQLGEPLFREPDSDRPVRVDFTKRLLDPACGSGTFLILAIRAIKEHARRQGFGEADTLEIILNNVVGIDLNPLAVLAARVGYLLAIADLVPYRRQPIVIPVHLADSILTPTVGATLFEQGQRTLDTVVGRFPVPERVDSAEAITKLADILHGYVQSDFSTEAFLERMRRELGITEGTRDEETLRELYEHTLELKRQRKDGIWARVLKNYFMPLFIGQFDYVAGNPPWVNWENLPDGYRVQTAPLWDVYSLSHRGRSLGGSRPRLGAVKVDVSTLMAYVAIDRFLRLGGRLAFLITQSVFKTAANAGFRRFEVGRTPLRVVHVDDMSELQPFEGASNRTAGVVIQKGASTRYPAPYTYWRKTVRGAGPSYDSSLDQVESMTARLNFVAVPVRSDDPTSPWLTARPRALAAIRALIGTSGYDAHAGVCTWANGVYWLEVLAERADGLLVVRNAAESGRRAVQSVTCEIESALVYPLLRGRDVRRWRGDAQLMMLVPQRPDMPNRGYPEERLQRDYPKTYAYLKAFEQALRARSGFRQLLEPRGEPFYAVIDIDHYSFAANKVVWREQAAGLTSAAIEAQSGKAVLPDHKLMMVECGSADEAAYLCATLNSAPARLATWAYAISIQQDTHILEHVAVPRLSPRDSVHRRLARLGNEAHRLAATGDVEALQRVEAEIDEAAAELWGITPRELAEIQRNLEELLGTPAPPAGAQAVGEGGEEETLA
jgi:hypothetical protein